MLNQLTIKKQSDLTDLIKLTNEFIENGGILSDIKKFKISESGCGMIFEYNVLGIYNDKDIMFSMEKDEDKKDNYNDILIYSNLDVDETYKLYVLITK